LASICACVAILGSLNRKAADAMAGICGFGFGLLFQDSKGKKAIYS
jgi:hypothetical protein